MKNKQMLCMAFLAICITSMIGFISCTNNESAKEADLSTADSAEKMIEKGRYLAHHVSLCMDCHSQRDFSQFSGPLKPGTEGMGGEMFDGKFGIPGVIYSRNITSDSTDGIGKWTDEEIERAITKGINRNGDTLFPLMPYPHYNTMSREDVQSIIAYIRTIKPIKNSVPERKLFIPMALAYPPLRSQSLDDNRKPDVSDMVKYGEYLTNSAACMDCHTPMDNGQFVMKKYMGGGYKFDLGSFVVVSANITPDSATGIGTWGETAFLDKFRNYRDPATFRTNPGKNNSIMPWSMYANMDDFDIKAIYRYLRTIPAVKNAVVKYPQ